MEHRCAEILEVRHIAAVLPAHGPGKVDTASLHYYINVGAVAPEQAVAHVTSYHKSSYAKLCGELAYCGKDRLIEELGHQGRHSIVSYEGIC